MEKYIKLIWDFKGPNSSKTAEHHEIHLKEYLHLEGFSYRTGYNTISEMHSIAYMIVIESDMKTIRDALKPHRGQLYTPQ